MVSPSFSASIRTFFRATISSDLVSRARSALRKGNWLFTEHVTWTNWSVSPQYFLCCLTYTQCHMFLLLFGWVSQTLWHFCSSQTEERKEKQDKETGTQWTRHSLQSCQKKQFLRFLTDKWIGTSLLCLCAFLLQASFNHSPNHSFTHSHSDECIRSNWGSVFCPRIFLQPFMKCENPLDLMMLN